MKLLLATEQIKSDAPIVIYGSGGLGEKLVRKLQNHGLSHRIERFLDSSKDGHFFDWPVSIAEDYLKNWDERNQLILASSYGETQTTISYFGIVSYLKYEGDELSTRPLDHQTKRFHSALDERNWIRAYSFLSTPPFSEKEKLKDQAWRQFKERFDKELATSPYVMPNYEALFSMMAEPDWPEDKPDQSPTDLIIYDRIFPSLHCSFALQEFHAYLQSIPNSKALITGTDFVSSGNCPQFDDVVKAYANRFEMRPDSIEHLSTSSSFKAKHFYTLFLRGVFGVIDLLEKHKTPFSFTLYSGGEYGLNCPESDRKLERVLNSPYFTHVITVERVTRDYLIERHSVPPEKIKFLFGPITNATHLEKLNISKKRYPQDKSTFDICFIANKHMPGGLDKGFDTFVEIAKILSIESDEVRFHIVGGFEQNDLPDGLSIPIEFHGHQPDEFFPTFHQSMDIVLSPCRPFILAPGAFDGAPNVCTAEAGLCGVAVFVTDQLKQNTLCKSGRDLEFISDDPKETAEKILRYLNNPPALYELAENGRMRFKQIYSYESQIDPRIQFLKEAIASPPA